MDKNLSITSAVGDITHYNILNSIAGYAFSGKLPEKTAKEIPLWALNRHIYILYENQSPQCASVYSLHTQNVRDKIVQCAGIECVCTYPEGRRKGYIKRLLKKICQDLKEKSIPFSTLYPFRTSFYEKMGWVGVGGCQRISFKADKLAPALNFPDDENLIVERTLKSKVNVTELMELLDSMQKKVHGFMRSPENVTKYYLSISCITANKEERHAILIRNKHSKKLEGYMDYTISNRILRVSNYFHFLNPKIKNLFLKFLALHIDQVDEISLQLRPDDQVYDWFLDLNEPMNVKFEKDKLMHQLARIIIVEEISGLILNHFCLLKDLNLPGLQFYAKIKDDFCEWNNGVYKFEQQKGKLLVTKITEPINEKILNMDIKALSYLVYCGASNLSELSEKGWMDKVDEEMESILQMMFPFKLPYFFEKF